MPAFCGPATENRIVFDICEMLDEDAVLISGLMLVASGILDEGVIRLLFELLVTGCVLEDVVV